MNPFTDVSTQLEKSHILAFPQDLQPDRVELPLVLQPQELVQHLDDENVLVIDVRILDTCVDGHISGAVSLPYPDLLRADGVVKGLLPSAKHLSALFSRIGLTPETHVVAYDDDSGTAASRLLWTLDIVGHRSFSLLNGGFAAWDDASFPITNNITPGKASSYRVGSIGKELVEYDTVLLNTRNPNVVILDARSKAEFAGEDVRAKRGGHIPGAVNLEWIDATDPYDNFRIRNEEELRSIFLSQGVTPDKEIIVYCQTHHRSSHTYIMLKHLGYPQISAYVGSWAEWGNHPTVPIEI